MPYVVIGIVVAFALILCFALAIASFSFDNYKEKLTENDKIRNSLGISTYDYVNQINQNYFGGKLKLSQCPEYQDHYTSGTVSLSARTMQSNSLASLAIISHELGHARQDFSGDKLKKHWALRRSGKIVGFFFLPVIIAGAIISLLAVFNILPETFYLYLGLSFLALGVLIFVFALILKYREIQIEKEASVFAIDYLKEYLTSTEVKKCKEFLDSARLTYWASLLRTMFGWSKMFGNS